jgi:hypothetical protein
MTEQREVLLVQIYTKRKKVMGANLSPGMWVDSLDHRGACAIKSIEIPGDDFNSTPDCPIRHARYWCSGDTYEVVRVDVAYDVVDPETVLWTLGDIA